MGVAVEELAVGRVDLAVLDLDLLLGKGRVEVVAVLLVGCRRGGDAEGVEVNPMDGHFVAGMPLVVAEPLVVAHVELPGGNPHEAGDRPGLGMLAGRGLQPGRAGLAGRALAVSTARLCRGPGLPLRLGARARAHRLLRTRGGRLSSASSSDHLGVASAIFVKSRAAADQRRQRLAGSLILDRRGVDFRFSRNGSSLRS